jgi:antitoxin VapB
VFICGENFFMKSEIAVKTERLKKMLADENLGGVLINAQHNFAWLTGGASSGIDLSRENGACFLLVRGDGKRFVLANNIEMPRLLAEEISAEDFEPIEFAWEAEKASGDFVVEKAKSLLENGSVLVSDLVLSNQTQTIENLIAPCRYELTETEIERFRQLGKDAGSAIGSLFEHLKPGETEIEIARKVRDALAVKNIDSIVNLVGADERIRRFRHPVPTENVWKKVLMIVVCARRGGLIASLTRIACIGGIPTELERRTEAAAYVFARLLSETKLGVVGAKLYQIASEAYAEKGFAGEINLHHQGGAAGYKTRDWTAHPASRETVRKNQAFAWNPSITGTKAEETCLLTEGGKIENLTVSPGFPNISVVIGGREFISPGILSL